jgi:drug/metabolite transporter (DMT)-like permease
MFIWGDAARVPALTAHVWWLIAVSSFLGIALSHVLYYAAIQRLGASIATGVHLLGPFVTMVLANVFLGESMGRLEWGAGAIMVAGAALLLLAQEKVIRAHPQAGEAL